MTNLCGGEEVCLLQQDTAALVLRMIDHDLRTVLPTIEGGLVFFCEVPVAMRVQR